MKEEIEEFELDLKKLILETPNDMELGNKLRLYYLKYENRLKILIN